MLQAWPPPPPLTPHLLLPPRAHVHPAAGPTHMPLLLPPHAQGATIGDVFVSNAKMHHDRRIPLPGFEAFGIGYIASTATPKLQVTDFLTLVAWRYTLLMVALMRWVKCEWPYAGV